jgi:hypothetical protein
MNDMKISNRDTLSCFAFSIRGAGIWPAILSSVETASRWRYCEEENKTGQR